MTYLYLTYAHLALLVPAFVIGTVLMVRPKGTAVHRAWGRLYMLLMVATSIISLFMEADDGYRLFDHFGPIHALSLLTLFSIPAALYFARINNIPWHRGFMIGTYTGALLIVGAFALMPGRFLYERLFA